MFRRQSVISKARGKTALNIKTLDVGFKLFSAVPVRHVRFKYHFLFIIDHINLAIQQIPKIKLLKKLN